MMMTMCMSMFVPTVVVTLLGGGHGVGDDSDVEEAAADGDVDGNHADVDVVGRHHHDGGGDHDVGDDADGSHENTGSGYPASENASDERLALAPGM